MSEFYKVDNFEPDDDEERVPQRINFYEGTDEDEAEKIAIGASLQNSQDFIYLKSYIFNDQFWTYESRPYLNGKGTDWGGVSLDESDLDILNRLRDKTN